MIRSKVPFDSALTVLSAGCAVAAVVMSATPARASLMNETVGGNAVVLDTSSDLQWLDASATLGLTPAAALDQFPGYSLATVSQVNTLLASAGIPGADLSSSPDTYDATLDSDYSPSEVIGSTIGFTYFPWSTYGGSAWEQESWGNYLDGAGTGWNQLNIDARNPTYEGSPGTYLTYQPLGNVFQSSSSQNFSYLVQSVPEPASIGIIGLSVAAVGLRRRRQTV